MKGSTFPLIRVVSAAVVLTLGAAGLSEAAAPNPQKDVPDGFLTQTGLPARATANASPSWLS